MGDSRPYKRNHDYTGEDPKTVHYTKIIGRKRVVIPPNKGELQFSSPFNSSFRKQRSRRSHSEALNRLELLPQDILIRVLCCVDHNDLNHLIFVSKAIRDAALIAKDSHFVYKTPMSKLNFKGDSDLENVDEFDIHEAPNAPRRVSRTRLAAKDLVSITVALFAS
uniref:F-box protein SKIP27 n=1 Tax=Anthurium amnicola TaxID=1678845 RepID=A0A1D1Y9D3_9ARAE